LVQHLVKVTKPRRRRLRSAGRTTPWRRNDGHRSRRPWSWPAGP